MDGERRRRIQAWMVQFADGERAAFQPLFDALWPIVLSFTARTVASQADAEDAAQMAMLKVFSRIADFDRARDGLSWVLGIAGYEVMTVRKQRARRREAGPQALTAVPHDRADAEELMIGDELRQAALALVGELPDRDRAALAYAFAGESAPADETSRKRRFRALARLRAAWRRAHG
ncbi:MAG: sigma-70 family RNA polymerase sigma factor [Pseudomonadota bacterium]